MLRTHNKFRLGKVREGFLEEESPEMTPELMPRSSSGTGGHMHVLGSHKWPFQVEEGDFVKVWRPKSMEAQ